MTEISFDDLIPQGEPKAAALPVEGSAAKTAGPFTVTPQVTEAPKAPDISFDDLIPKGVTGGGWKRNVEAKPEEMSGRERAFRQGREDASKYDRFTDAVVTEIGNIPERWNKAVAGLGLSGSERSAAVSASDIGTAKRLGAKSEEASENSAALKARIDQMSKRDPQRAALEAEYIRLKEAEGQAKLAAGDTEAEIADERAAFGTATAKSHENMDAIKAANEGVVDTNPQPGLSKTMVTAIASLAEISPGFVASVATRNPLPMMTLLFAQSKGSTYADKRSEGVPRDKAETASNLYALAESIPEALPLAAILSRGTGTAFKIFGGAATERVSEIITSGLQSLIDVKVLDENMTWGEATKAMREAGNVGAAMGAMMGSGASIYEGIAGGKAPPGTPGDPNTTPPMPSPAAVAPVEVTPAGSVDPDAAAALAPQSTPTTVPGAEPAAAPSTDAVPAEVQEALNPKPKTAAEIARERLKAGRPVAAPTEAPTEAAAAPEEAATPTEMPQAPQETPQEAPQEASEPPAVPEAPETIEAQREALKAGQKKAVLYTPGTPVPAEMGGRIKRIYINGAGVFDYDSRQINAATLRWLAREGRLNDVLDLGPYNKAEVAESTAAGAAPAAVVERTPAGAEVKAAAGTVETVPEQVPALEETKLAPENTVTVEDPRQVLQDRVASADNAETIANAVRRPQLSEEEKQELVRKYGFGPDVAPAAQPAATFTPSGAQPAAPASSATQLAAKGQAAVEKSKERSKAPAPPEVRVTSESKRQVVVTTAEQRAEIEAKERELAEKRKAEKVAEAARKKKLLSAAKAEQKRDVWQEADSGAYLTPEEEVAARRSDSHDKDRDTAAVARATKVRQLQDEMAPKRPESADNEMGAARVYNRLTETLKQARLRGLAKIKITKARTNAEAWLEAVRTMQSKLARLETNIAPKTREGIMQDLGEFLEMERQYLKTGDASALRQSRLEAGTVVKKKTGELKEEVTAAAEPEEPAVDPDEEPEPDPEDDAGEGSASASVSASKLSTEEVTKAAPLPEAEAKAEDITAGKDKAGTFKVEARKMRRVTKPGSAQRALKEKEEVTPEGKAEKSGETVYKVDMLGYTIEMPGYEPGSQGDWGLVHDLASYFLAAIRKSYIPKSRWYGEWVDFIQTLRDNGHKIPKNLEIAVAEDAADRMDENNSVGTTTVAKLLDYVQDTLRSDLLIAVSGTSARFPGRAAALQAEVAKHVSAILKELVGSVRIAILPDATFNLLSFGTAEGYYISGTDTIVLPESLMDAESTSLGLVVIHEAAHAAMLHTINRNPKLRAKIDLLREHVVAEAERKGYAGDKNFGKDAHEFMSEVMTDPQLQQFLAKVKVPRELAGKISSGGARTPYIKNALDAVKSAILDMLDMSGLLKKLGLSPFNRTALDMTFDLAGTILDRARITRTQMDIDKLARSEQAPAQRPAVTRRGKPSKIEQKLRKLGLNRAQAKEINDIIRDEFGGKATDAELKDIADAVLNEIPPEPKTARKKHNSAFDTTVHGIRKQAEKAHDELGKQLKGDFVPNKNPGRPWLLKLTTNYQIAERADRWFGAATNPVRVIAAWIERRRVTKARYMKELTPVLEALQAAEKRHTKEQWNAFLTLAQDSTLANVHPDRPLDENTHLGKDALRGVWGKARHPDLAARYDALPEDLQKLYGDTRDALTATQNSMTLAVVRNLLRKSGHPDEALARRFHEGTQTAADYRLVGEEIAAAIEGADALRKIEGPYFNLVRRGKFVVKGKYKVEPPSKTDFPTARQLERNVFEFSDRKEATTWAGNQERSPTITSVWVDGTTGKEWGVDKDGTAVKVSKHDAGAEQRFRVRVQDEYVEFVDSLKQAKKLRKELVAEGLKIDSVEEKKYERDADNAEMLSDQMLAVMKTLDKRGSTSKLSAQQRGEMAGALNEIALRFLGSTRIQSSKMPRRNVAGADLDIVRNTFDYINEASGYLAKLDTAPVLEDALVDLERRVSDIGTRSGLEVNGARSISNEIERRVYARIPGEDDGSLNNAVNRVTSLSFLYNLASPAYSFVNSLQVAMLTLPQLAADFNSVGAMLQLRRAYKDIGALGVVASGVADTARAAAGKMVTGDRLLDDIKARLPAAEGAMLEELASEGLIDADGGLEIARVVDRQKDTFWGKFDSTLYYLDNIARAAPQSIEMINRATTALAAYRMMLKKTKDPEVARRYAKDLVNRTQMLMSNSNAAPVFSSPAGRVALQFKKFGQGAYYMLGHNIGRMLRPQAKGERIKGLKATAYVMATHAVAAGAAGLPFSEFVKLPLMVFNAMGLTEMAWEDFQNEILAAMEWLTGEDDEDDEEKKGGLAEMLTFGVTRGIPGGWGFDLNSRVGMDSLMTFGEPQSSDDADVQAYILNLLTGPTGRLLTENAKAATAIVNGGLVTDPLKIASQVLPFKLLADAARAYRGGARGEMNGQDMTLRVLGLRSGRQANISREIGAEIRDSSRTRGAQSSVRRAYTTARTKGEIARATSQVREYNASLPKGDRNRLSLKSLEKMRLENIARYAE